MGFKSSRKEIFAQNFSKKITQPKRTLGPGGRLSLPEKYSKFAARKSLYGSPIATEDDALDSFELRAFEFFQQNFLAKKSSQTTCLIKFYII